MSAHVHTCIDMCAADMCAHMCAHMCADICVDIFVHMDADVHVGMRKVCKCPYTHTHSCVHTCVQVARFSGRCRTLRIPNWGVLQCHDGSLS